MQQQLLRDLQAQQAQQAQLAPPQQPKNSGLQLKWTETAQRPEAPVESLDAIQAEQRRYLKVISFEMPLFFNSDLRSNSKI